MNLVSAALMAYLIGSIPFSLLLARWVGGIDLRQHGSGNVGATNVARTLGWTWGSVALLLDALKGAVPVLAIPLALKSVGHEHLQAPALCAFFAIIGHMFPVWLNFRGGKGVATGLGAVTVLSPWASLIAAVVFAVVFAVKRIVSIGSILAALAFVIAQVAINGSGLFSRDHWGLAAFSLGVPLLIIGRHSPNIRRLLTGTEQPLVGGQGIDKERT